MNKAVEMFVNVAKENNCTTEKQVKDLIRGIFVQRCKEIGQKMSEGRLNALTDDYTESVCIELNIPQDGK